MRYHHSMNRYTYRAEWSSEHSEYVGRCLELPWLFAVEADDAVSDRRR